MEKQKIKAKILELSQLVPGIFSIWMDVPDMAHTAVAGQFVSLYMDDGAHLLPRPISICEIDRDKGAMRFVFRVAGKGTKEFSEKRAGDLIPVLGPLGNGYTIKGKKALLFGGGIGIPPMLELAKELKARGHKVQAVLGYRDSACFLREDFLPYADVYISTEDGSVGTKGNVVDAAREHGCTADQIYACGPKPMLRGVKQFAQEAGIAAQVSMEERMACGIGACLACVCQSVEIDGHSNVYNKRICKDGPVFYADEIEL